MQASMGSLTRIDIVYEDLIPFLKLQICQVLLPIWMVKMCMKVVCQKKQFLIMGNEANGISDEIRELVDSKISIPRFGDIQQTESLNVATATAILLSEFKRS